MGAQRRKEEGGNKRERLHSIIKNEPGLTTSEIVKKSGFSRSVVRHHLNKLLREESIVIHQNGRSQHHFISGSITLHDQANLAHLREGPVRRVVLTIASHPKTTFTDLMGLLEMSPSSLHDNCKKLERLGLINRKKDGNTYFTITDPKLLHTLLTKIQSSLLDRLVDHFLDSWK